MRKYCLNCGQKFYPKGWTGYPQTEYAYDFESETHQRAEVLPEQKHFHSLTCMKEWIAKNIEAVDLFLTNMGNNDNNNETIERT
jgi:hypothetical protein